MNVSQDLLRSFARVGTPVEQWIAAEKASAMKILAVASGELIPRAQGRYNLLAELEDFIEKGKQLR
jgi:hypothetical protein